MIYIVWDVEHCFHNILRDKFPFAVDSVSQVFKFVSISLVKGFWRFVISVDNSGFIQGGSFHRTVVGRNGIIKFNPVVIVVSKREDLPAQETTLSNILGISNSSKYSRNAKRELGRNGLFSKPLTCEPFGAGFDLSVLTLQTYGQRGRREHTLLVGHITYVGLSKWDLEYSYLAYNVGKLISWCKL